MSTRRFCGGVDFLQLISKYILSDNGVVAGVAKHVTVWLPGFDRTLSLCEVQVWGERVDEGMGGAETPGGGTEDAEASLRRDAVVGLA